MFCLLMSGSTAGYSQARRTTRPTAATDDDDNDDDDWDSTDSFRD